MSISLQTNVTSLFAQQALAQNASFESNTIEQLTSGYRINSSGDDAAGLAVANQYSANIAELQQGVLNASNGTSILQIIDGGLSNISSILNRLQTLATESASATFAGNRTTLNQEFQSELSEITRQANNIGLAAGGQYNGLNSVFIGGGNNAANGVVTIDLSGSANQVDASGLGIASASVGAGGTELTGNLLRLDAPGALFLAGSGTQDFTFNLYSSNGGAQTVTASVSGGASGLTQSQVLSSLNQQLSSYGISATVDGNGQINFGGGTAFTVTAGAIGAGTGVATAASTATNSGVYEVAGKAVWAGAGSGNTENLEFQNAQGAVTVSLVNNNTPNVASAISQINAKTAALGIYAVLNTAGTGISFQSDSTFQAGSDTAAATFTNLGVQATNTPSSTGTETGNAVAALASITNAISALGLVQGRVGAGENLLNYASQLANSQITNFSAAESAIKDANVAAEAANLSKAQTLQQSSIAALAQANAMPAALLKLLQ
ncbi:MAG TPA: flagellin [Bryobacteraceae bacterium]|nr:flagellin [Bryobacteraceae bacterium]